jgi:hypothetical protein
LSGFFLLSYFSHVLYVCAYIVVHRSIFCFFIIFSHLLCVCAYIVVHISRQRDILIAPSFTAARDNNTRREERRLCWANQNDKNHNLLLGRNANQCLDYGMSRSLHLKVKVSEYRKGTKQLTIHRNCQFTVHKTKKNKTKTQHKANPNPSHLSLSPS